MHETNAALRQPAPPPVLVGKTLAVTGLVLWLTVAWCVILCWYLIFGLWLVPYRLIRRSQRRDEQRRRQHAELLAGQGQQGWR